MTYNRNLLEVAARNYCKISKIELTGQLGFGTQGIVYKTSNKTAIKAHAMKTGYIRERDIYSRLQSRSIVSVQDFAVPRLKGFDDELQIIEMSIVHVPCILDFGGAYLNTAPEHMTRDEQWLEDKAKEFGDNWLMAQQLIRELEFRANIWLVDVNNGNIKFSELR